MNKLIKIVYLYFNNLHISLSGMPWIAVKRICKHKNKWKNIKWASNYGLYKQD